MHNYYITIWELKWSYDDFARLLKLTVILLPIPNGAVRLPIKIY